MQRRLLVREEARERFGAHDREQFGVAPRGCGVVQQRQGERALVVRAGARGVAQRAEPRQDVRTDDGRKGRERGGPPRADGFSAEQLRPCEAIGSLEPRSLFQILCFDCNLRGHERGGERGFDFGAWCEVGQHANEPQQEPVRVNGRMPVEATEEDRVRDTRRHRVSVALEHVLRVVRVLARDVRQSAAREIGDLLRVQLNGSGAAGERRHAVGGTRPLSARRPTRCPCTARVAVTRMRRSWRDPS